ncbi:MAG: TetR/AcrR family transcriptional regulator [Vicinamibacteria bacterium]|nr:TetR/AcrR family transcriptional regulator [Vicinamibacteria bacterium]
MSKGETTRSAILDVALATASKIGLEALTIGGLAREAGLSKSGLFAHFASKEDLQLEVVRKAIARFVELVIAPALKKPRGEPRVRALFENWFSWSRASELPGGCLFIAASSEFDDQPGPVRDLLLSSQKDWLGVLAQAARVAVEEGHFKATLDAEQFAWQLDSFILGYHHSARLLRSKDAQKRAQTAFESLIRASRA